MQADSRLTLIHEWLHDACSLAHYELLPLAGDASFRRYFRIKTPTQTWVLMDAPPEKESSDAFVLIANAFKSHGLVAPEVLQHDLHKGLLLISDLGDNLYYNKLDAHTVDTLYEQALKTAVHMHSCQLENEQTLPFFDEALYLQECALFSDWYLPQYLQVSLTCAQERMLQSTFHKLIDMAHAQPQVFVHRDYHSRNLFLMEDDRVGIIDFQDAVVGPITYDAVSLLRDCYIDWPQEQVEKWVRQFQLMALEAGILDEEDPRVFMRWFDYVSLQRHFKCMGIFARLYFRDGKSGYLEDIPRVLHYATTISARYPEFSELHSFLKTLRSRP